MSNMSYCRFVNTVGDVRDCMDALREYDNSNPGLLDAAKRTVEKYDESDKSWADYSDAERQEYESASGHVRDSEESDISDAEKQSARELIELCRELVEEFEHTELV